MKLTANDMLKYKLIDSVIKEPLGGAHSDMKGAAAELKKVILKNIKELNKLAPEDRINARIEKFGSMGVFSN